MAKIAKVLLPLSINREFDYLLPPEKNIKKGSRVLVDFRGKTELGIVSSISNQSKIKKLKTIIKNLDKKPFLAGVHFQLAEKLSSYYLYPVSELLFLMLPPYLRKKNKFDFALSSPKVKTKACPQKPKFIKENFFLKRYNLWKEDIKTALAKGSVIICLPQLTHLKKISKAIKSDSLVKPFEFYSRQKIGDSFTNWLESRKKSLILTTRSGLFYFPQDTRLIIIDEEASPYYFQETKPFYQLQSVALTLSKLIKSKLIFTGSYPSLFTYAKVKEKKIDLIETNYQDKKIEIIARDYSQKNKLISPVLTELIRKTISEKKTGAIIWNRKNFWRVINCSQCNHPLSCAQCSGLLQQNSQDKDKLLCPYCQKKIIFPQACPQCKNRYFKGKGMGIEKLKEILSNIFPELSQQNLNSYQNKAGIIFSTSIILNLIAEKKSFDYGFLLDSDSLLASLDFESTFKAFTYIKNLSLLFTESLFVFSNRPQYYLFNYLNQDWKKFYDYELLLRKKLELPPFAEIIKVILRSRSKEKALKNSKKLYNTLKEEQFEVFEPLQEFPHKLREKYRYSVTIKLNKKNNLKNLIHSHIDRIKQNDLLKAIIVR